MSEILAGVATEHRPGLLLAATIICVLGSTIAVRLIARVRRTQGFKQCHWLFLASLTCGSAIWTTHFVAMLGYRSPLPHAYALELTLLSFFIAIAFSATGIALTASTRRGPSVELGGAVVGLGIAAMHYCGMAAYEIAAVKHWDAATVAASIAGGAIFGAMTMNRLVRRITRFCKFGSMSFLILAILTTHYLGMAALTVVPDPTVTVPPRLLSDGTLAVGVIATMSLVLSAAASIYLIDARSQSEALERYRHLAMHDQLTNLPNRTFLAERLQSVLSAAAGSSGKVAVLAIDLDRFKAVNDVHGHGAGDYVLQAAARRLETLLQGGEFLARIGGDEFVVVKHSLRDAAQAEAFARRIADALARPIVGRQASFMIGASIGGSLFPDHGATSEELMSRADLALYRAKDSTVDRVCLYEETMDETSRIRSLLTMELRQAIARGELELLYQPQHAVDSGALLGFEALLRWHHPKRGLVRPDIFIPIAEKTGLILPIGEWVLRRACAEAAGWSRPCRVAVNVAPAQFLQGDLPRLVAGILAETGLAPGRLELEITESAIIEDQQYTLHVIRQLKALGVRIAMDDYGTGHSLLSLLKTIPFDKIKIDQSLIRGTEGSSTAAAIVKGTILLAHSLDTPVLAEGVETEEQLVFLKSEGCQEAQGFYFGHGASPAAAARLIRDAALPDPAASAQRLREVARGDRRPRRKLA